MSSTKTIGGAPIETWQGQLRSMIAANAPEAEIAAHIAAVDSLAIDPPLSAASRSDLRAKATRAWTAHLQQVESRRGSGMIGNVGTGMAGAIEQGKPASLEDILRNAQREMETNENAPAKRISTGLLRLVEALSPALYFRIKL